MAKLPSGPDVRVALPPKPANDGTVAYATAARAYDANVLLRQQVIANLLTFFAVYTFPLGLLGLNVFLGFLPEDWGDNLSPAVGDAIESIMMIHLNLVGPFAIIILLITTHARTLRGIASGILTLLFSITFASGFYYGLAQL